MKKLFALALFTPFIIVDIFTTKQGLFYFFDKTQQKFMAHFTTWLFAAVFTGLLYLIFDVTGSEGKLPMKLTQKILLGFVVIVWCVSLFSSLAGLFQLSGQSLVWQDWWRIAGIILLAIFCSSSAVFLRIIHDSVEETSENNLTLSPGVNIG